MLECPTNILVIQILWALASMPSVIVLTQVPTMCRRIRNSKNMASGCNMSNRYLTLIIMSFLAFFIIVTSALKIIFIRSMKGLIGINPVITIVFCITNILAYVCVCFFQYQNFEQVLLAKAAVLRSSQKRIEQFLNSIREVTNFVPHISLYVFLTASPFIGTPSEDALDAKRVMFYIFFAINISINIFTGHTALRMKRSIRDLFSEIKSRQEDFLHSHESLLTIEDRLHAVQNEILMHTTIHILLKLIFVAPPQMRTKTSYLLPFSFMSFGCVAIKALKMYRVVLLNPDDSDSSPGNHSRHVSTLSQASSGDDGGTVVVESDASDSWRISTLKGFRDSLEEDSRRSEPLLHRAYFS